MDLVTFIKHSKEHIIVWFDASAEAVEAAPSSGKEAAHVAQVLKS